MDTLEFLQFTITARQGGWLNVSSSQPNGTNWRQYWRGWPDDAQSAVTLIQGLKDERLNVYYSCHLFTEQDTHKKYAMDTRTMFSDLDEADVSSIPVRPSLLLKSSNHRNQSYWRLNDWLPIDDFEQLSKRVTYGITAADHSGWSIGHIMRVPNTFNWKYAPPERVRVSSYNDMVYDAIQFGSFPPLEASEPLAILPEDEWIESALKVPVGYDNAHMYWETIKNRVEDWAHIHYYNEAPDRSRALWNLMHACFRAGLKRQEVYLVAFHSKNNKFAHLRYNGTYELAKDVIRAEREVMAGPSGIRGRVKLARHSSQPLAERRAAIAEMAKNQMMSHGRFIHVRGGSLWYILNEEGKPIPITRVSTALNAMLDNMFGLNATETEHNYTVNALINYTSSLPVTGELSTLSHYMPEDSTILIHTGSRDILRITPTAIDTVTNGYKDIVFQWTEHTVTPDLSTPTTTPTDTWHDALFGMSMDNLAQDTLTPQQVMALLRSWFITILMRNAISSRPILALFGQPGSGKSTLFNRVNALLYGAHKAVSGIGTPEEFDYAMASSPLYVIDNVDTWERWLPDRIARAAGISEITRRKLYTDLDVITVRLQAYLGITAHNPKFGREDVLDRLIMITFERIQEFADETQIVQAILQRRDAYWGQIAHDVQRVLSTPLPNPDTIAQFRVQDFSKVGQWIANALDYTDDFHSAIASMVDQQKGFVLDEDSILVNIIQSYITNKRYANTEYQTPAKLWGNFDLLGGADKTFSKQYGNSIKLGRKLWAMQDALRQRFNVEWRFDPQQKTRVWRFTNIPTTSAPTPIVETEQEATNNGTEA